MAGGQRTSGAHVSLKVLVIDRSPPVSLRQGNALIGIEVLSRLAHHDLTLVAPATPDERELATQRLSGIFRSMHLVPRNHWTPALAGSVEPDVAARLGSAPGLDLPASRALTRCIAQVAQRDRYDVLHVRQLPMAGYGAGIPSSGRVLELIDSETLGAERARPRTWRTRLRAKVAAGLERRAIRRFDVVTTVALADADRLHALASRARVEVVPNGVDAARFQPDPGDNAEAPARSSSSVRCPSRRMSRPCAGSSPRFCRRRHPSRCHGHDRRPGSRPGRRAGADGVTVTGAVDDVRPFLARAAVVVAPMVSGSGIKNKILEAMAMRGPWSRPPGRRGLAARPAGNMLVADGAAAFATAVARLLADPDRGGVDRGRRVVRWSRRRYTWEACAAAYAALYAELAGSRRARLR